MEKGNGDGSSSKKTIVWASWDWASYVLNTPIIITILEIRKLETWRDAFLKTTKLVSGKTGI